MQEKINELQKEFLRIKKMGWIKEKKKGSCSIGYTFEELLKKSEDNFPLPDFYNVEIKTMNTHSKMNLHLFNLTPDGECFFPIKKIIDELGCPDKDYPNCKKFYCSFKGNEYTKIIYGRYGRLNVNRNSKKIELLICDNKNENINIGISWSFNWLLERLNMKMTYLALVKASSRIIDGEGFYYYHTIRYYKLKDFDNFLSLIEKGIITVTFKIGFYKEDRRMGEIYDHGTDYSINVNNIDLLYDEIKI